MIPAPPPPEAHLDFETYSEAGYLWDDATGRWTRLPGAREYGLPAVGSAVYAEHPSTEILCACYSLPDAPGIVREWRMYDPPPADLHEHIKRGGLIRAHHVGFERQIWAHVAVRQLGWPPVDPSQWRCSMATARVNGYPPSLADLGDVLAVDARKDKRGKQLISRLCVPRQPTKHDPRRRILPYEAPDDYRDLVTYCAQDVRAEMAVTHAMVPMSPDELAFWQIDQEICARGVAIDRPAVDALIGVMESTLAIYGRECEIWTGGIRASQGEALKGWLAAHGVYTDSLDADHVEALLARTDLPPYVRRVIEVKALTASASVKKLYAMRRMVSADGRIRNLYNHHGARTGRPTGADVQPTNLPKAGPDLYWDSIGCPFGKHLKVSPWTGEPAEACRASPWSHDAVDYVIQTAATGGQPEVERIFGDSLHAIAGCIRGLFVASGGYELISSDYSAIEAVVAACISGEQWRIDTFRRGEDIYLASIGKMRGRSIEYYRQYKDQHGQHHPDRADGKIAELALGFGGWIGALRAFGAEGDDDRLKALVLDWRRESPTIVEMWGGQGRGWPGGSWYVPELYGLEGAAVRAIQRPDTVVDCRGVRLYMRAGALIMRLLSGRELTYHNASLWESDRRPPEQTIWFSTYNTNPKYGAMGWTRMDTYGGRLFENLVQATAHDIQRHSIIGLRRAGYPTVLHTYDEDTVEVRAGRGSVEEVERIMSDLPAWAAGWPIRAAGGWRGRRYRKD